VNTYCPLRIDSFPELVQAAAAAVIVMLSCRDAVWAVGVLESVTVTVKFDVPVAVGVPEITPVEESGDKPAGSVPSVTLQV
jgi:hypothetical protein